jgi:hypothetical protein
MRRASFVQLRCDVRVTDDDLVVQFLLDYEFADGGRFTLTGPELGGFPRDFAPTPARLERVIEAFWEDAADDLAREDAYLDSDVPREGVVITIDDEASRILDRRHGNRPE